MISEDEAIKNTSTKSNTNLITICSGKIFQVSSGEKLWFEEGPWTKLS